MGNVMANEKIKEKQGVFILVNHIYCFTLWNMSNGSVQVYSKYLIHLIFIHNVP